MTKPIARAVVVVGAVGTVAGVVLAIVAQFLYAAESREYRVDYDVLLHHEGLRAWGVLVAIPSIAVLLLGAIWTSTAVLAERAAAPAVPSKTPSTAQESDPAGRDAGAETRLVRLRGLREDGLITDDEYRQRRTEILDAL